MEEKNRDISFSSHVLGVSHGAAVVVVVMVVSRRLHEESGVNARR